MKLLSLAWISAPLLIALAAGCTTAVGDLNDEEDALEEQVPTDADGANLDSEADGGAGGGPTIVIECSDESPSGTSGTCEPADDSSECQQCVAAQCCEEQSSCNSSGPDSACGFGSTLYNGAPVDGGDLERSRQTSAIWSPVLSAVGRANVGTDRRARPRKG